MSSQQVEVRNTRPEDFPAIVEICREVYPNAAPWGEEQLASHLDVFPEGQFVAVDRENADVLGMAASLILLWDDYDIDVHWRDVTAQGMFTNHDPEGRTLYGAEIMVRPRAQGRGVGKAIYQVRRELVERLGLLRIRAGSRLRDYNLVAETMGPEDYVRAVVAGRLTDRTLTFQLHQGFHVLAVVEDYLAQDPASRGHAALIEWVNDAVAGEQDYAARDRAWAKFG